MAKSIKLNALFKTIMSILNILFPLITAPYIARILSVDGYTEFQKANSMITWFSPFALFGVYTYGMRTISQVKNNKEKVSKLFSELFTFNLFSCTFVTIIYLILVFFLPSLKQYQMLYLIFASQIMMICLATDWVNEAFESYGFMMVKSFFIRLLYVILVFFLIKSQNDIYKYVIISCCANILNNSITFLYAKSKIPFCKINIRDEIKIIKPLFVVFLLVNASLLFTVLDRFILTFFSSKLQLTYYSISQSLTNAVIQVSSSILLVSIPRLSNLWGNNLSSDYYSLLKKSSSSFLAIHTPFCIGMAVIAKEIVFLYSGVNYIDGYIVFLLFSCRYYISGFDMILSKQVLLATNNEKVLTKIYYLAGAFNLFQKIILLLFNVLTPETCVITTALADIFAICMEMIQVKKLNIKFSIISKDNLKYLITSCLFIPISIVTKMIIPFEGIKNIIIRLVIIVSSSVVLYGIMMIITKDELVYTLKIKKRK